VLFLLNEKPLMIPGCQSDGLCKTKYLMQKYGKFIGADCDKLACSA
jgi:hypothetical protein